MANGVKKIIKSNRFLNFFYEKIYYCRKNHAVKRTKKRLQKHGKELILAVNNLLKNECYIFFFDMGTLIGIIREGMILKHDADIDVGVIIKDRQSINELRDILLSNGFSLARSYQVEGVGTTLDTFIYKKMEFDLCYYEIVDDSMIGYLYYREPNKEYLEGCYDVVLTKCTPVNSTSEYPFAGSFVKVPYNFDLYLTQRYNNWRIPDKSYIYWKANSTIQCDKKGYLEREHN